MAGRRESILTSRFETESVSNVKTSGNQTTADVTGTMTIHGVSNKLTTPVKLTYLKDKTARPFSKSAG